MDQEIIQEWLSIEDVAKLLKINKNTVRRAITNKELKATRMGRGWRLTREDVQAFIARRSNMEWVA